MLDFLGSILGGLFDTPEQTPGVQTQQLPAWYEDALKRLLAGTEAEVASKPYQFYNPARRVADLTETQKAAIAATPEAAGAYMPGLSAAFGQAGEGVRTFPNINMTAYMSPYQQAVTDIEKREAQRAYDVSRPELGFAATQRGAFGGARHGVQEAEAERNLQQRLADIQARGSQAAFTQGTGLLQNELARQLQGAGIYSNLASSAQNLGLTGLSAVGRSQDPLRSTQQDLLDKQYAEYMRGQQYGMDRMGQLSNIVRGLPTGSTTTTTNPQAGQNPLAAGIGLVGAGTALYNAFPGFSSSGASSGSPFGSSGGLGFNTPGSGGLF